MDQLPLKFRVNPEHALGGCRAALSGAPPSALAGLSDLSGPSNLHLHPPFPLALGKATEMFAVLASVPLASS